MLHPIDYFIILLYLVAVMALNFILERKASSDLESYFLGVETYLGGC